MKHVVISGYNSFIGNFFYKKYKNKFKISKYKKNINNSNELKKFLYKKNITHFINFAGLSREKCLKNQNECLKSNPDDNLSKTYIERCNLLIREKPKTWDGIWVMKSK